MKYLSIRVYYPDAKQMMFPETLRVDSVGEDGGIWMLGTTKKAIDDREIFDGDIITFTFSTRGNKFTHTGKVFFDEYMWCVETTDEEIFSINRIANVEIIGNIHETPELFTDKIVVR